MTIKLAIAPSAPPAIMKAGIFGARRMRTSSVWGFGLWGVVLTLLLSPSPSGPRHAEAVSHRIGR